ncbi:rhamnogalacturonan acetylesterase [Neobacillus cucumis]|nr:rhamnogalacturonan acetylesterase [Neobacillus cucumis]
MKKRVKMKIGFISLLVILTGLSACIIYNKSVATPKPAMAQQAPKPVTIYLAGDSTVSDYPSSLFPRSGWGQVLPTMLDQQVTIRNFAKRGRSSKSFINEGRLNWILNSIQKGDYLFIQFGHNDEKVKYPNLHTNPNTTYKSYLKHYIDGARKKGAIPILVTPVQRMSFSSDGRALNTHGRYPAAMKALAKEENVPVIDLASKSRRLYQQLGSVDTKRLFLWLKAGKYPNYPQGVKDPTHFQEYGAEQIAKLVIEGIEELHLPLENHILAKYR